MLSKKNKKWIIISFCLLIFGIELSAETNNEELVTPIMKSELDNLRTFLVEQITPNNIVPKPAKNRDNLVISYRHDPETSGYKYVYSRTATYDNAAAIIALSILKEHEKASGIIDALQKNIRPDGDLWFIMNTHNYWPNEADNAGAMIRTGTSSWAGYAVCFYILSEMINNPKALAQNVKLQDYLMFAEKIADAVIRRQITDRKDFRFGLITGGDKTIALSTNNGEIIEKVIDKTVEWISIEHNIDSYFFLRDLAFLSKKQRYQNAAAILKKGILNTFNYHLGHFERGFNKNGPDPYRALDCASWGTMFLLAANEKKLAGLSVDSLDAFKNSVNGLTGFKPYIDTTIYEGDEAQSHYYGTDPKKRWNDIPFLWSEGSFGAALAYIRIGKLDDAKVILESFLTPTMNVNGGIRYADRIIEHQFTNAPSVIGSAWAIIAIKNLEGDKIASLFWSDRLPDF